MKALRATSKTQSQRSNDFNFCEEGELVCLAMACDREDGPDGTCGCLRCMDGITSARGTTTMEVFEIEESIWIAEVLASKARGGWYKEGHAQNIRIVKGLKTSRSMARRLIIGLAECIKEAEWLDSELQEFAVGTVVERRDTIFNERKVG